jgi:peroxiredoxin
VSEHREPAFAAGAPRPGEMLPSFELPNSMGGLTGPRRYKGRRPLVIIFLHGGTCAYCRDLLSGVTQRYPDYLAEESEVLAIVPLSLVDDAFIAYGQGLPFPIMADAQGAVHRRYGVMAGQDSAGAAVFVADRYGEVQERWLAGAGHDGLPNQTEVLDSLRFIGIQCPE